MKNKTTVYIYYPSFQKGGIAKILINLVNYFLKKNIKVLLFSQNVSKKYFLKSKNFRIVGLKKKEYFNFFSKRLSISLSLGIKMLSSIRHNKNKITILSMQEHLFSIFVSVLSNTKIIVRNSEDILGATKYSNEKLYSSIIFILKIIFYQFADKIITLSKMSEKSLKYIIFNQNKVKLIYNPYIKTIFPFKKKIRSNMFSILSAGRLTHQKNFELLLRAVKKLQDENYKVKLNIIGSGPLENRLKLQSKKLKYIKFFKWKKNLNKFFIKSNLFVLPSFYEGSPNILLDAVNSNIPVISSNCSGASDILKNNNLLFKVNNEEDLIDKIKYVIENYNIAINRSKNAKKNLSKFLVSNSKFYLNLIYKNLNENYK